MSLCHVWPPVVQDRMNLGALETYTKEQCGLKGEDAKRVHKKDEIRVHKDEMWVLCVIWLESLGVESQRVPYKWSATGAVDETGKLEIRGQKCE